MELLADRIVEKVIVAPVGDAELNQVPERLSPNPQPPIPSPQYCPLLVHVLPKPGVMDPVAQSVMSAIGDFGLRAEVVRTLKKYWIEGLASDRIGARAQRSWPTTPSSK